MLASSTEGGGRMPVTADEVWRALNDVGLAT
jgi:hypothetical protein